MNYVLGLDIGITSVGWAVLELDTHDEPIRIVDLNSRIFEKAEVPKTGESLAAPRRMARSARRLTRRRRFRLHRVRRYLIRNRILDARQVEELYVDSIGKTDIYELRYQALSQPVSNSDWARLLIFFAKHRGFKSNRKHISDSGDEGQMLNAITENQEILNNYHTVGEMLYKNEKFKACKRNKGGSYAFTVSRDMLADEIHALFDVQRSLGQAYASEELEEEYMELFSAQRNFDEGPGMNSPYSGNQIEKMIGCCTFEDDEKRAPKASYAFMAFNVWQKINHLRVTCEGTDRSLSQAEKETLAALAWKKENITFKDIRNKLGLDDTVRFLDVNYNLDKYKTAEEAEKKVKFSWVKEYHAIRKALDKVKKDRISELSHEQIDTIAYAFTVYKNDEAIKRYLLEHAIELADAEALLENISGFSKFGHLSVKACYKLLEPLQQGHVYTKACEIAGYDPQKSNQENISDIPNPVVKRALSQALKVIKAIIRQYGCPPVEIHIELARELAKSAKERTVLEKAMKDNQSRNEKIKTKLHELNVMQPTGLDIVKYKLYEQQQGDCAYSQKKFDVNRLLHDPTYAEVDHIIPYSRSFDDTYRNKVLVLTKENRDKGNRTPMEYFQDKPERKEAFINWVKRTISDGKKRNNLLRVNYSADAEKEWKDRHLQDTQYISRYLYNYLKRHIELKEGYTDRKRRIIPVNGAVTAYVRKRLGISKIRENGDLHHAVDAVIIACVTQGVVNKISRYSKIKELRQFMTADGMIVDKETGEVLQTTNPRKTDPFPEPWPKFRQELEARVSDNPAEAIAALGLPTYKGIVNISAPFVSRMPNRKVHGPAHADTIRSPKLRKEGYVISKTTLSKLKLKNGEIEGYYNPSSDRLLYEALKQRLEAFGGDGKKAFKEPFYKPKADGTFGAEVKKVKLIEAATLLVSVNNGKGVAQNDSNNGMVRVDVFGVDENGKLGYYFVPIYVADTIRDILPNKAIIQGKKYTDWKVMKDDDFLFSLYSNDLIYIESAKEIVLHTIKESTLPSDYNIKKGFLYYKGTHGRNATLTVVNHDGTYTKGSMGAKGLLCLKKCTVDVLGNIHYVKKERRLGFK
ncbi:type II CRISPR RNA-guided endonuclease Cas9 [Megasphaera stantonii]|uniref:CRISPR-associated endonuclease Cas9 n=1 Tax=Megasphaera stantonii TaxID=2144175 RepID=A0A346B2C8_9FIRM|nr:type II CRISPR RNA-guided endonuclease Cas9 [Megasphaera stantonii]AXL22271.1 type II CRISPR RNA-guided endonuclease Cas9 [Megasphaera stantonii]